MRVWHILPRIPNKQQGLLLRPDDVTLPAFDTTVLHAAAAVAFSLAGD